MSIARIFQDVAINLGDVINLDDRASHYLARVLRAAIHDELTLFNGRGGEYQAIIIQITKKSVQVKINAFSPRASESPIALHLAQGIAKGEKMDFIVQKAVELGVKQITPLITERCNVRLDSEREEKRVQHWQGVVTSACEQSGRNTLPQLMQPIDFKSWLANVKTDLGFVLSPHVSEKLPKTNLPTNTSVTLLIGPEGGLSQAEVDAAIQHGFKPLNLGPRVLRTETATIAALSTLQYAYGDFG